MKKFRIFLIKRFFYLLLPYLFFKRLIKAEIIRFKIINKGYKHFSLKEINQIFLKKENKNIVVLGSGLSINKLTNSSLIEFKKNLSMGISRWIEHEFVPDLLFSEFTPKDKEWLHYYVNKINSKSNLYESVIFIFDVSDSSMKLHSEIYKSLNYKLRKNIRFMTHLNSVADIRFMPFILESNKLMNFLRNRDILLHCRASAFYGGIIGLFLKAKNVHLVGLDGYSGYFFDKNISFDTDKKNLVSKLHSIYDKKVGSPTIIEAFQFLSKKIYLTVQNTDSILSKYFRCKPF